MTSAPPPRPDHPTRLRVEYTVGDHSTVPLTSYHLEKLGWYVHTSTVISEENNRAVDAMRARHPLRREQYIAHVLFYQGPLSNAERARVILKSLFEDLVESEFLVDVEVGEVADAEPPRYPGRSRRGRQ